MSAPKSSSSGSLSGEDGDCGILVSADCCGEASEFVIHQEVHEWDFLKSIVYGGLVESITSLGVVSSAAGAGATTLSILVLGLVNLIGGLLIFCHNLRELKNERYQWYEDEGQYQKLLGRRGNFPLQASLAVISFLFFGLLPPVIYGFSFRESDNKDLKLAVVLGVSLICIILLVIAKCHVTKSPPKSYIKTILYYLSTGVVVSCVSYLAGELIKDFLEKLGWFDSTSTISISSIETSKPMESTWAAY
ncbi:membrane protein of ER body-like protein [Pistacia vera]|uniref:membrane protein of ER body-like protein n=1 Tax=Pistacia vera TaxID=55513 RepID=UPI001262BDF2|nr:membrane protein of ER body-like protein [Pistacia vera]